MAATRKPFGSRYCTPMFRKQTLFIVGAGASFELGMPLGSQLAHTISNNCRFEFDFGRLTTGDHVVVDALRRKYEQATDPINAVLVAMSRIRTGINMAASIDNYIDMHSNDLNVAIGGKLQIAVNLLRSEKSSSLYLPPDKYRRSGTLNLDNGSWLHTFTQMLFERVKSDRLDEYAKSVSVICFNYDRCIEAYLAHALEQTFHVTYAEAVELAGRMVVVHPYGSLGMLPPDLYGSGNRQVAFGADPERVEIWDVMSRIKTYTEQVDDEALLQKMRSMIRDAEQIVYLGFAYHPQNMHLLTFEPLLHQPDKVAFASGKGVDSAEDASVRGMIAAQVFGGSPPSYWEEGVRLEIDKTASQLMTMHRRNLLA